MDDWMMDGWMDDGEQEEISKKERVLLKEEAALSLCSLFLHSA